MGGGRLILLDTHVLIWLDQGASALGARARRRADAALREDALAVSAISFWEVSMLAGKGRIEMPQQLEPWRRSLLDLGLHELALDGEIALLAGRLADLGGDPADRFIAATAVHHGAALMTADRRLLAWPRRLQRVDARA